MTRRINKFLVVVILVATACFLFHYNRQNVRVSFGPASSLEAPLAVILLAVFFCGAFVVGLVSVVIGARSSFSGWLAERRRRRNKSHTELLIRGRELLAIKAFSEARSQFNRIAQQDPQNILSWHLLAQTFLEEGDLRSALDVLNEARIANRDNIELLARTAEIQEQFGNTTSAYDNYALVLAAHPGSAFVLRKLVDCSLKLEQFEEAGKYLHELARRQSGTERENTLEQLAQCELQFAKHRHGDNHAALREALEAVLRHHKNYAPAMVELAYLDRDAGQLEKASKLLTRAFQQQQSVQYLEPLATMWLSVSDPSRAVAAVRGAVVPSASIEGSLFLISLYLYLEMLDEANSESERLEESNSLSRSHRTQLQLLKAHLLARQGRSEQVSSTLLELIDDERTVPTLEPYFLHHRMRSGATQEYWQEQFKLKRSGALEPSPQLSTP